jgi:hypothetical protein
MKFYDDFIGNGEENVVLPFTGGDSERQFLENQKRVRKDWYYFDHPISYSYNEYGHRSKNIKDIDLDNYVIFTGCSHTVGVGLELEKTFPYLVSQKLGVDYYNIAMAATGIDVLEYNLLTWFAKVKKKPKYVFIQWPDHSRFASYRKDYDLMHEVGSWSTDVHDRNLMINGEDTGLFYARKELARRLITQTVDAPIHSYDYGGQQPYGTWNHKLRHIDWARDLSHTGIKSHAKFTDLLCEHIQSINS